MTTNYITVEDARAATLCDLASARLRLDREAMARLTAELNALGYARAVDAAETIARAAIDAERAARRSAAGE
jgi:hypothetical protein